MPRCPPAVDEFDGGFVRQFRTTKLHCVCVRALPTNALVRYWLRSRTVPRVRWFVGRHLKVRAECRPIGKRPRLESLVLAGTLRFDPTKSTEVDDDSRCRSPTESDRQFFLLSEIGRAACREKEERTREAVR